MRSLVVSIIMLLLCFGVSSVNTHITLDKTKELISMAEDITRWELDEFSEKWEETKSKLRYTVRRNHLRNIDMALYTLETAPESDFNTARATLIYNMKELYNSQSFSLKTIL